MHVLPDPIKPKPYKRQRFVRRAQYGQKPRTVAEVMAIIKKRIRFLKQIENAPDNCEALTRRLEYETLLMRMGQILPKDDDE